MRFAICNELFHGWKFRRVIEFVAATGYDGLEIAPFTLAETVQAISSRERKEIRKLAAETGIALTGLHWLLVKPSGLSLLHPEKSIRNHAADYLRHLIDLCADLGGTILVFGSPNERKIPDGVARNDAWQWAIESFAACGPSAKSRGVTICLEALPANLTNFLNTNAEVIELVQAIAHPNIRMMLDVKSMCAEPLTVAENIRRCRGFFHHVHANDENLMGPGFGRVDFKPILGALSELDYRGFVSVEVFDFSAGPEATARQSLRYLRDCLAADHQRSWSASGMARPIRTIDR